MVANEKAKHRLRRIKFFEYTFKKNIRMENELLRFAEFIDSEPSLAIASPRLKVKMYLQKIASDGDLADVSASALKSAYDVCYTMKSHCGNAMAGADEGDEGYDADKEMYEKAKEFIDAYEAHLRLTSG